MGGDLHSTLYERLGGDPFMNMFAIAFFDEIVETEDLHPFYKNISASALKNHQVKLFRVMFGEEEKKPSQEDFFDYMFRTHARLFRELGMNETHFDQFVNCFAEGLKIFQTDQALIDECVATLVPLRALFEYGAQVAVKEKAMSPDELNDLPQANPKTIGTGAKVVLPEYAKNEIPTSLKTYLKKNSKTPDVRVWTCALTNRFGMDGDQAIADTFLAQPYMDHQVYLVAFLELAFLSADSEPGVVSKAREIVLFPRGPKHSPLSRALFDKMSVQFLLTCHLMGMSSFSVKTAETTLLSYRDCFALKTTAVGGVDAPHILQTKNRRRRKTPKKSSSAKSMDALAESEKNDTASNMDFSASLSILGFEDDSDNDSTCSGCLSISSRSSDVSLGSGWSFGTSKASRSSIKQCLFPTEGWSIFRFLGNKMKVPSTIGGNTAA